jgi:hypothetical protein
MAENTPFGKKQLELTPDAETMSDPAALKAFVIAQSHTIADMLADPSVHSLEVTVRSKPPQMNKPASND